MKKGVKKGVKNFTSVKMAKKKPTVAKKCIYGCGAAYVHQLVMQCGAAKENVRKREIFQVFHLGNKKKTKKLPSPPKIKKGGGGVKSFCICVFYVKQKATNTKNSSRNTTTTTTMKKGEQELAVVFTKSGELFFFVAQNKN